MPCVIIRGQKAIETGIHAHSNITLNQSNSPDSSSKTTADDAPKLRRRYDFNRPKLIWERVQQDRMSEKIDRKIKRLIRYGVLDDEMENSEEEKEDEANINVRCVVSLPLLFEYWVCPCCLFS